MLFPSHMDQISLVDACVYFRDSRPGSADRLDRRREGLNSNVGSSRFVHSSSHSNLAAGGGWGDKNKMPDTRYAKLGCICQFPQKKLHVVTIWKLLFGDTIMLSIYRMQNSHTYLSEITK